MAKKFFKRNSLLIVVLLIFVAYFVYSMYITDIKLKEYQATQVELNAQIGDLEDDIDKLNDDLEYAQTTEAIEKIAREKLKMVKPNEIIYMIKGLEDESE